MECPKCKHQLKKVKVKIQDAKSLVTSYQCRECGHFDFEEKSINKALEEIKIKETPLRIKQKIIKLSQGRLGMYFNKDIVRSLDIKSGEEVYVSVPDKRHVILNFKE